MAKSKLVKANEKIEKEVVGGYKKIESIVVTGYRKIENSFIDRYLIHDGESVEEARARLQVKKEAGQRNENYGNILADNCVQKAQIHAMEHRDNARKKANI